MLNGRFRKFRSFRSFRGIRRLKRGMQRIAEKKWRGLAIVNQSATTAAPYALPIYSGVSPGNTVNTRVGNRIRSRTINIKLVLYPAWANGGATNGVYRVMVVSPLPGANVNIVTGQLGVMSWRDPPVLTSMLVHYDRMFAFSAANKVIADSSPNGDIGTRALNLRKRYTRSIVYNDVNNCDEDVILCVFSDLAPADPTKLFINGFIQGTFTDV